MEIIEGFLEAKKRLSRQVSTEFYPTPLTPGLESRDLPARYEAEKEVRKIVDDVYLRKDAALLELSSRFDGVNLTSLEVTKKQIASAYQKVDKELVAALELAAGRIRSFHRAQKDNIWHELDKPGLRQLIRPLKRIGIYIPGGTAAYPSTVLMTAIPARVAGVDEVIMVTPPGKSGTVPPSVLVAAHIAEVDCVFCVGGAQAIAALAFGTESIPKVDKICGPGNIFVTLAKRFVYGEVDIDGLQGPSDVLIIADENAKPEYCAADLLAQAEHDPLASANLITTSRKLANRVNLELEQQIGDLPRKAIASQSLKRGIIVVDVTIDEAIELANLNAPEHLCLMVDKADSYVNKIRNAGCIIAGRDATVVISDYVAGPSHALPTGGTARFSSPLSVNDFIKFINVVSVDDSSLRELGEAASIIARAEGLEAHARAVERFKAD